MNEKNKKAVLIVDNQQRICEILKDRFEDCNEDPECPYAFEVDLAFSAAECIEKIRAKNYDYDVIVLDIRMEDEESGLNVSSELSYERGWTTSIRIIFTGFPNYRQCVKALRHGAWDYIVKEDVGDTPIAQIVVDSALARLRQLDLRQELEQQIAVEWMPRNLRDLQAKYGGQLVALWHEPKVKELASGRDAFELEAKLKEWHAHHADWEQPFIVKIPPKR